MAQEKLVALVEAMDRSWRERRFDELAQFLSPDIVVVAPNGMRVAGRHAAVDSYREFVTRCIVERYEPGDYAVTESGDTAVVEYGWRMAWRDGAQTFDAAGREVLVLARQEGVWRIVWRAQQPDTRRSP
jgi:ketosteroid isomerase-like protein